MGEPRVTLPLLKLLNELLHDPVRGRYGLDLARGAGLSTGTTYPILARLEAEGWLSSDWESIDPSAEGRRPRRYYKLTGLGHRCSLKILAEADLATSKARGIPPQLSPRPA